MESSKGTSAGGASEKETMMTTPENNENAAALNDSQLEEVQGGLDYHHDTNTGKYYKRVSDDWDSAYLCPNCGKPVHQGLGARFYCDDCSESWYFESNFSNSLNLTSGCWQEITHDEYKHKSNGPLFYK